jgi:membrane protein DedA with SNARE-associated domain
MFAPRTSAATSRASRITRSGSRSLRIVRFVPVLRLGSIAATGYTYPPTARYSCGMPRAEKPRGHSIATWAGLTTLATNLAAINVIALLGDESSRAMQVLAATITAVMVAATVYTKQRWEDAKAEQAQSASGSDESLATRTDEPS